MSTLAQGAVPTEGDFIALASEFVLARTGLEDLNVDTELIESGIMDSLLILEFFFFLEELRGSAVDPSLASVDALSTIRNAYQLLVS